MANVFMTVLNMSLTASYVILVVFLVRLLLKRMPKIFSYALWAVVLFRLIFPFSFESAFSLIPKGAPSMPYPMIHKQISPVGPHSPVGDQNIVNTIDNPAGQIMGNFVPAPAINTGINTMDKWIDFGTVLWVIGLVLLITYGIFMMIRLSRRLKSAKLIDNHIYEVRGFNTAFVFGLIKPKIYLPVNLSENEKTYIIAHEQTHIQRFDYLIKPFAFLVLAIHWFNPLVWLAFYLMSADMELSCDERVLKKMGSKIKKEYSTSLLALSIRRRILGGCPLAFGENNPRGRIMNILNYRKPAFWLIVVAAVIVTVSAVGLTSNPIKTKLSVEDYAHQYVQAQIESLTNTPGSDLTIVDQKITRLEKMASFDHLLAYPVELWILEYRLQPNDISKVSLAGGMNEVDGWLTEDSSMGKPILVFSYQETHPEYLGNIWSGEVNYNRIGLASLSAQETALQAFLERGGLLPPETFGGDHVLVQFPLSTGETSQLLLSQPAQKGAAGIWCVERWMDGNGNIYYVAPETAGLISDYFQAQQYEADHGDEKWRTDPVLVALDWINHDLGQYVAKEQLVIKRGDMTKEFTVVTESHFIGYISNFKTSENGLVTFDLEKIEWLTLEDTKRLKELGIDPNELPNGFYIHKPQSYPLSLQIAENGEYRIIELGAEVTHKSVSREKFMDHLAGFGDTPPPFRIKTKGGYVQSITEQYLP